MPDIDMPKVERLKQIGIHLAETPAFLEGTAILRRRYGGGGSTSISSTLTR